MEAANDVVVSTGSLRTFTVSSPWDGSSPAASPLKVAKRYSVPGFVKVVVQLAWSTVAPTVMI